MSDWQPISTAPTDDEDREILVWDGSGCDVVRIWWWDGGKPVWFNGDVVVKPTHWMPLPSPPDRPL